MDAELERLVRSLRDKMIESPDLATEILDVLLEDFCPTCKVFLNGERCWGCYESYSGGDE